MSPPVFEFFAALGILFMIGAAFGFWCAKRKRSFAYDVLLFITTFLSLVLVVGISSALKNWRVEEWLWVLLLLSSVVFVGYIAGREFDLIRVQSP